MRSLGDMLHVQVFRTQQSKMLLQLHSSKLRTDYFELSRFDFVVDDELNVFLMEVSYSKHTSFH